MRARLEFRLLGCSSADSFRSVQGNHKYSSVTLSNKHGRTSSERKYWNAHLGCGSSSCCCCVKNLASLLAEKIESSWRCNKNENYNALTELARCWSLLRSLVSRLQSDLMIDFCTHTHLRGEWWSSFNISHTFSRILARSSMCISATHASSRSASSLPKSQPIWNDLQKKSTKPWSTVLCRQGEDWWIPRIETSTYKTCSQLSFLRVIVPRSSFPDKFLQKHIRTACDSLQLGRNDPTRSSWYIHR